MITDYTTTDQIRAVLGVSPEEVEDADLTQPVVETLLVEKLDALNPLFLTQRSAVVLIPESSRTSEQKRYLAVFSAYCTYCVADILSGSLSFFTYRSVTDGKAEMSRQVELDQVLQGLRANLAVLFTRLKAALAALDSTYTPPVSQFPTFMTSVGLSQNPVTGV